MIACCSDRTVAALLRTLPDYRDWTESAGTTRGVCLEGSGKYSSREVVPEWFDSRRLHHSCRAPSRLQGRDGVRRFDTHLSASPYAARKPKPGTSALAVRSGLSEFRTRRTCRCSRTNLVAIRQPRRDSTGSVAERPRYETCSRPQGSRQAREGSSPARRSRRIPLGEAHDRCTSMRPGPIMGRSAVGHGDRLETAADPGAGARIGAAAVGRHEDVDRQHHTYGAERDRELTATTDARVAREHDASACTERQWQLPARVSGSAVSAMFHASAKSVSPASANTSHDGPTLASQPPRAWKRSSPVPAGDRRRRARALGRSR